MSNISKRGENSYRFTVYYGMDAKGVYKRKTKTHKIEIAKSPKQLKEHLDHEYLKFKQQVHDGEYVILENISFNAFVDRWENNFAIKELSDTAYMGHMSRLNNHIKPIIGHHKMSEINTLLILDLISNLTRKDGKVNPLSHHAKEDVYKTLKSVFKYAKQWNVISKDPMVGVNKPKNNSLKEKDLNVYEAEEVRELFLLMQNEPFLWRMFITLAITAGFRRGENLGLDWTNINFESARIDINKTIVKGKSGAIVKTPKSRKSIRSISMPQDVMEQLKRYRIHWISEKLKMGDKWNETKREWLFCNEDGTHYYPTSPTKWWRSFCNRTGFRFIRLHDLRHTSASLLIAQREHAKIISDRLGHADIRITMDTYGHTLRSADEGAAKKLDGLLPIQKQN